MEMLPGRQGDRAGDPRRDSTGTVIPGRECREYGCSDRRLIDLASRRMAAYCDGQGSSPASQAGIDGIGFDPPWGQAVVAFMAGKTVTSKLSLPALYSAAVWYLGWQDPLAWVALLIAVVGFHVVLPHLYTTHYLQPLEAVRNLAAKHGLSVTPFLRITDWEQRMLCEAMAAERSSVGWLRDTLLFMGLLSVCGVPCVLWLMAIGCVTCSLSPVVLGTLLFVPLRARATARGQHSRRQWLDLAADVYCCGIHWVPVLANSFPTPQVLHGVGDVTTSIIAVSALALMTLARVQVLQKPVRWCIVSEAAVALCAVLAAHGGSDKLVEAGALLTSVHCAALYVWNVCAAVAAAVCVAWRAKSEAGYLQAFLDRDPEKYHGHVLRPRLGLVCKFRNATPADLPLDLREKMLRLAQVEVESLDGLIRPGCLLLSLSYRFGDVGNLEAGRNAVLDSLRDVAQARDLPWDQMEAVVCVGDTRFTVQGGMVVKEEAVLSPVIVTVDQLAVSQATTLTLKALGLGSAQFAVVLRTDSDYVDLEVISEQAPDRDTKLVTVWLPEAAKLGMAWLELHSHADSDCPIISEGFPLMFAPSKALAEELSSTLLHKLPTIRHVSSLLEDLAKWVCAKMTDPPEEAEERLAALVSEVVQLELPECFNVLAAHREVFKAALRVPPGLLSTVVKSQSAIMLHMVLAALDVHGLPFEPCRIPDDSPDGLSPLHMAAQQGSLRGIGALLDTMPDAEEQWHTLRSGVCRRTPAQLMEARWPWFSVGTFLQALPSFRSRAVWGTDLVGALSFQTTASSVAFPSLYLVLLAAMGWREPLAWLTCATLCAGLHVMAPALHKDYVRRLHQVREVAQSCKLLVTQGMRIMDTEVQICYELSELRRSSWHPVTSSLLFMAAVLPAVLLPGWQSWKLLGEVEHWTVIQAVVALFVLTLSRWWAIKAGCLGARQLVDLVAWNYCVSMVFCHRIYMWASSKHTCFLPEEFLEGMKNNDAFAYSTAVMPFMAAALLAKMLVVSGPLSWLAWPEPLLVACHIYLASYKVDAWCFNLLTGDDLPSGIGHAAVAFWLAGSLFCLGMRVRSEAVYLQSFLAGLQKTSDVPGFKRLGITLPYDL